MINFTDMKFIQDAVWRVDYEFQSDVLEGFIKNVRGFSDDLSGLAIQDLIEDKMFYVPHDNYLVEKVGPQVKESKYGLFRGEFCVLNSRLAIPLRAMDNSVLGFIGYTNQNDFHQEETSFIKYLYPKKSLFVKSNFLYITREEYLKALREEYVCIVDGIFDKRRLQSLGINACSLCGSVLTKNQINYLQVIKNKVVIADNDEAGRKMANYCLYNLENCVEIRQPDSNDIDDYLKKPENVKRVKEVIEEMKTEGFLVSHELKGSNEWGTLDHRRFNKATLGEVK